MTDLKVNELINAYSPGASKEALQQRQQIDKETQDYLDENLLNARYDHWLKMAYWNNKEATALFAGFEPQLMDKKNLPGNVTVGLYFRLEPHNEAFKRAVASYELAESDKPIAYVKWSKICGVRIPKQLEALIENVIPPNIPAQENTSKERALGARERETLLKMIIAMATDKYGYDPTAQKSGGVSRIQSALERTGFKFSDDTIRAKLQEAQNFLSPEYSED